VDDWSRPFHARVTRRRKIAADGSDAAAFSAGDRFVLCFEPRLKVSEKSLKTFGKTLLHKRMIRLAQPLTNGTLGSSDAVYCFGRRPHVLFPRRKSQWLVSAAAVTFE
jgi:hypothetical protein